MSLPKLYLETTIPSYLTARRSRDLRLASHQEVTEEWWADRRHEYDIYTSAYVRKEAAEGNPTLAAARLAVLDGIPVLPTTEEVETLAEKLLAGELIPAKAATDVFHIAIAAVHRMDFLLTWNCQRPPALPFRAVLSHRLSRSARLHAHSQPQHHPPCGAHLRRCGLRLPGDLQSR